MGFTDWARQNGFSETQIEEERRNPSELSTEYEEWRDKKQADFSSKTYRSSHFDEPNVLAHVRFNERTDAEGKRVLFIEEIQSDFLQEKKEDMPKAIDFIDKNFYDVVAFMESKGLVEEIC